MYLHTPDSSIKSAKIFLSSFFMKYNLQIGNLLSIIYTNHLYELLRRTIKCDEIIKDI